METAIQQRNRQFWVNELYFHKLPIVNNGQTLIVLVPQYISVKYKKINFSLSVTLK